MPVARLSHKVPENVPGDLFVDDACISCDVCRRIAPRTFGGEEDGPSFVARQPTTPDERRDALQALVACPVSAIGSVVHDRVEVKRAAQSFPSPVEGAPGVFDCGYASPRSFGASSWLKAGACGLVASIVVYVLFTVVFKSPLPQLLRL